MRGNSISKDRVEDGWFGASDGKRVLLNFNLYGLETLVVNDRNGLDELQWAFS